MDPSLAGSTALVTGARKSWRGLDELTAARDVHPVQLTSLTPVARPRLWLPPTVRRTFCLTMSVRLPRNPVSWRKIGPGQEASYEARYPESRASSNQRKRLGV
jgi:hypothetical protein